MSLLKALDLPAAPGNAAAARPAPARDGPVGADDPRLRSTIIIANRTDSDLRLLQMGLQFKTARFAKGPPPVIAPHTDRATFRVVEPTVGASRTAGAVKYHLERRRFQVNVNFAWSGRDGIVTFEGDGRLLDSQRRVTVDTDNGNTYEFELKSHEVPNEDPLQIEVKVKNETDVLMSVQSFGLDDNEHSEFAKKPLRVKANSFESFYVQALDEAFPEAAGTVVYRIERPDKPRLARLRWRRGATPFGVLEPDDGAFAVEARNTGKLFVFELKPHDGPPTPRGPTKVTIVNDAGFALKRVGQFLHNEKARFVSEPAPTIEGGRRSGFAVEAPDPEFPKTDGDAHYEFFIASASDPAKLEQHAVHMVWLADQSPTGEIDPPAEGVQVEPGGSATDVVFTVTGPALDFKPPEKVKQPTLRFGDKGADGWVEYLQEALNDHGANLPVTGNFLRETLKAVKAFQRQFKDQGVLEDGVVGDETWSLLREGPREKPKTDGRTPHTFKEKGLEARWVREKNVCRFDAGKDALVMQAISVGDTDKLEGRRVRIRVTNPQGTQKIFERSLGPGVKTSQTTQGFTHDVLVEEFATLFGAAAPGGGPPPGDYKVEAFFDAELGSDKFDEVVKV